MVFLKKKFLTFLFLFILLNGFLYGFLLMCHQGVAFDRFNYIYNANHFQIDPRINGEKFDFLQSLGQYDAQWYLKIAADGYQKPPSRLLTKKSIIISNLNYAFFPLYPIFLHSVNVFFQNITLCAFVLSLVLLIANFTSTVYIVKKIFSEQLAYKTVFLLLFFPFSIFLRSYYAESLQLLLLSWFCYFTYKKEYFKSGLFLGVLNITKGNLLLLNPIFLYLLWSPARKKLTSKRQLMCTSIVSILPFVGWMLFNFVKTNNPFYFYTIQSAWWIGPHVFAPLFNLAIILAFPALPIHSFHFSKIDVVTVVLVGFLLYKSYRLLPKIFWFSSFLLWVTPLLTKDLLSFTRYQAISFPLFIFLAIKIKRWYYISLAILFYALFLLTSLFFVNWYWIG